MQLQQTIELAGMLPYCDFESQVTFTTSTGMKQRPDFVIRLPNARCLIVDVKSPVDAYVEAMAVPDEHARADALRRYAKRIKAHMTDLARKEYWQHTQPGPELVILFLPNEAMFRATLQADTTLFEHVIHHKVLLASPLTLIALLKTIAYSWSQEQRAQNVQTIIAHSHTLYREFITMSTVLCQARKAPNDAGVAYDQMATLYQEKIVPIVQQIQALDGMRATSHEKALQVDVLSLPESHFENEP